MKHTQMSNFYREDGRLLTEHEEIEEEILRFYGTRVGSAANSLK